MPDEPQPTLQIGDPSMDPVKGESGPGSGHVGIFGIVALITYLVLFTIFLIYALVVVWPVPTPSGETADARPTPTPISTVTPAATQTGANSKPQETVNVRTPPTSENKPPAPPTPPTPPAGGNTPVQR